MDGALVASWGGNCAGRGGLSPPRAPTVSLPDSSRGRGLDCDVLSSVGNGSAVVTATCEEKLYTFRETYETVIGGM